jgi:hypothetical protein
VFAVGLTPSNQLQPTIEGYDVIDYLLVTICEVYNPRRRYIEHYQRSGLDGKVFSSKIP